MLFATIFSRSFCSCVCSFSFIFICRGCLIPVTSAVRTSVDIGASAKLKLVDKFCYLGDMLSVDGKKMWWHFSEQR